MTPDQLLTSLRWRYATKKFDPTRLIPPETWAALEETLVLTPSSFGLQPWQFIVVTDPGVRARLVPASWNQSQPVDASHFVVFARRDNLPESEIDRYVARVAAVTGTPSEKLAGYRNMMADFCQKARLEGWINTWADRQVYIALGSFMTAAASLGIDTCPMEGLDPVKYDEILGLTGSGFSTVVACAAGYRSPEDGYAARPKVRHPADEVIRRI
ncbi:MAG: NAD(P)H-dependent oxidoreductase [Verrucomicrobiales bacterium]